MSLILFDFECLACSKIFEDFHDTDTPDIPAKCLCGSSQTKRLIGATTIDPRLGLDPNSFPTMADKWARTREQRTRIESQQAASHGGD